MGVFDRIEKEKSGSSGGVFSRLQATKEPEVQQPAMRSFEAPPVDIRQSEFMKNVESAPQKTEVPVKPGRDIPVIGQALKAIDALAKVTAPVAEYATPDAPLIGQDGAIAGTNARQSFLDRTGQEPATGAAKVFGQIAAPFAVPGAGLGGGVNLYRGATQAIAPIAPRLGTGLGGRVTQGLATGAATGAPMAAGVELAQGSGELKEAAKQGVFGALVGGAADAAIPAIGTGAKAAMRSLPGAAEREVGRDLLRQIDETELPIDLSRRTEIQGELPSTQRTASPMVSTPGNEQLKVGGLTPNRVEALPKPIKRDSQQPIKLPEPNPEQIAKTSNPISEVDEAVEAVKKSRMRDRIYNALDDAEKAARERLAAKKNTLSSLPVDQYMDHAIIMAAKLGKGTIKAADFTEELVKEFGEQIRPHAQRVLEQTKAVLRQQETKVSKEVQDARAFNESGIGDAKTFETKISREAKKPKVPFKERLEKLRTQFTDDLAPLEGLEKRVKGSISSAEDSLYKAARMFKGTPEKASRIVQDRLAPIVERIEKAGFTANDLGNYALAKHARDVNAADMKSAFTNAEIEDVLRKYGTPEMEAAQQELVKINRDMMEELVKSGVVSRELADTLNERWKNYIPLFRSFDDEKVEFNKGLSDALANVSSPIKRLKGSERATIDPLENMVRNVFQSINAAERNKVARQLSKLAKQDKDSEFIRKLEPNEEVGRKNVVSVKENGESVRYEVEPEVYKALLSLDKESSNTLVNILAKPASLLRAGATLTPEFSLRNPIRDVLQAYVTSKSGFNPITDFTVGLIQSIKKGDLYKDWVNNLGAYGNVISMDRDVHRQALEKVLKQPPGKTFVNIINGKGLLNLLRAISDTTESATKVGEYRAALRKGVTKQEAAYRSRDLMDFARAGTSIRQTNRIVSFLNANIQGKSKLIRAIKENPIGTTTRMFTAVTLPTIGFYVLNREFANDKQKKAISDAPDWQKDTFWLVAIPGTDKVARIPKPFDIAPLFANLPERALQYAEDKDPDAFDGFVRRTLSDGALPVQITGLWPFIEGMANYSFFREGSIIPQREQNLQFKDQYDPIRTTETAKLLAAGAEKLTGGKGMFKNFSSPRIMDNTIKGLTAGLGTYATSAIDTILTKTGIVDRPTPPQKKLEQRPLAKAFLVDPLGSTKSLDKFYEEREKLSKEKASASINEREFKSETKLKVLDSAQKMISDINKAVRTIEASDMSAKEKREKIDKLNEARNEIARKVVKGLKQIP